MRARLQQEEGARPNNHFGMMFIVVDGAGTEFGFGLGSGVLQLSDGTPFALDTTVFHDYRVAGSLSTPGANRYDLFVDGALIVNDGIAPTFGCISPIPFCGTLFFGDGTGGPNARGEIANYTFVQTTPVSVPSSALLAALALGALAASRRIVALRST